MGKALKTVGVIIGGAALIATGVGALAMPALAGSTTLFGVSVGTLNTISSGLVAVGGMLDKPKSQGSAAPDEWTSNPDQPIPFLMGRMGVAGKIVQRDEFGPDNMYQGIVGIISGAGPIRAVTGFSGDKQAVTFGANGIAVTSQWQGEMWMVRRAGNQPDTVLTVPAGLKSGGSAFEWSPAARLSGKACYLQVLGENSKGTAYPAGIPDPVHDAEGIFGYDPRYDDTYPGGAGSCRLGIRSTYRWINDGGIGALNWALGLVENGQVVGGIGASMDGIDVPAFVEVANIADANGWTLAAWPDTSEDASAVLDQLLQAAGAVRARHAGKISCVPRGAPRASVATITARDTAGDIELDTAPSLFNRLNTITPRFMSQAAGWVLTPANPVSFAQYVTDDGGKHGDQIDYRFVSNLKQAAELAAYDILDAREPFSGTIPLKAHMRHLKRGDTFVVSEPGFLMDGVKCIVLSRSYDPKTAQVRIGFRSETDGKHALALGKTTTLPDFPVLTPTDPTYVSPPLPGDWVITPRPPGTGGSLMPGFDLSGSVGNTTATAIEVQWWEVPAGIDPNDDPPEDANWQSAGTWPPTASTIPIDVQADRYYWLGLIYIRNQNYSERTPSGPWLAGELIAGDVDPNAPGLAQIKADIEAAFGDIFDVSEELTAARSALEAVDAALYGNVLVLNEGLAEARADTYALYDNVVALDTGLSGLQQIVSEQSVDLADKASQTDLALQVVRIDDAAAINASQALALVDLENSKVALSEYEVLRGEVLDARYGAPSLLGQIQYLQSVDLDLDARKVEVTEFSELVARPDGVEAVNANQALALVDLENGKVALSEYDTLKGEVTAARDGSPSLLGKIQNLKSVDLDLQTNKASVASVDALTARTANTEADIIDIENAAANDRTATAQAIQLVTAKLAGRPNIQINGGFENGTVGIGWGGASVVVDDVWGRSVRFIPGGGGTQVMTWPSVSVSPGRSYTFTGDMALFMVNGSEPVQSFFAVDGYDGATPLGALTPSIQGKLVGTHDFDSSDARRQAYAIQFNTPANCNRVVIRGVVADPISAINYWSIRQGKLELGGLPATPYSAEATEIQLSASVTQQSLAIIDLENQQALASWTIKAAATGGRPTILQLLSGSFGSSIAMTAEQIYFGDNTVFDDASDTIQTVWGSVRKVIAWGAPFGPDGLVEWTGPSSTALGAMTKANAGFWQDQFGSYGPLPGVTFWAKATPPQITRTRSGAGSISTPVNSVIVTCMGGTDGATCTWSFVSGDPSISRPNPGFTPTFSTTLAVGQTKEAVFAGLVVKNGETAVVFVSVGFQETT